MAPALSASLTLLGEAFAEAVRHRRHQVSLNVDSESPTGATRLYESAGMRVEFAVHQWQQLTAS